MVTNGDRKTNHFELNFRGRGRGSSERRNCTNKNAHNYTRTYAMQPTHIHIHDSLWRCGVRHTDTRRGRWTLKHPERHNHGRDIIIEMLSWQLGRRKIPPS